MSVVASGSFYAPMTIAVDVIHGPNIMMSPGKPPYPYEDITENKGPTSFVGRIHRKQGLKQL